MEAFEVSPVTALCWRRSDAQTSLLWRDLSDLMFEHEAHTHLTRTQLGKHALHVSGTKEIRAGSLCQAIRQLHLRSERDRGHGTALPCTQRGSEPWAERSAERRPSAVHGRSTN